MMARFPEALSTHHATGTKDETRTSLTVYTPAYHYSTWSTAVKFSSELHISWSWCSEKGNGYALSEHNSVKTNKLKEDTQSKRDTEQFHFTVTRHKIRDEKVFFKTGQHCCLPVEHVIYSSCYSSSLCKNVQPQWEKTFIICYYRSWNNINSYSNWQNWTLLDFGNRIQYLPSWVVSGNYHQIAVSAPCQSG